MNLSDLSADQLITLLEKRGDAYIEKSNEYADVKAEASLSDFTLKRRFAATYSAIRNIETCSVEDAKSKTLTDSDYLEAYSDDIKIQLKKERSAIEREKASLSLDRVKVAIDLWRSHRADVRKV
jgi:hypothetical protein